MGAVVLMLAAPSLGEADFAETSRHRNRRIGYSGVGGHSEQSSTAINVVVPQVDRSQARSLTSAKTELHNRSSIPVVLCERDLAPESWREMLEHLRQMDDPPLLVVISRLADERLWAEALNLGAHDVLAKPFDASEVTRILSLAWLRWRHRHVGTGGRN